MKVNCPKCNSSLIDPKGGGYFTKCIKCQLDAEVILSMNFMKNEYEDQEI